MDLEELARLINKRWPDTCYCLTDAVGGEYLEFSSVRTYSAYYPADADIDNAYFIVWCLDRLEELGGQWYVGNWYGYCCGESSRIGDNQIGDVRGVTRAEALCNALYSKLKESVEPKIEDGKQ